MNLLPLFFLAILLTTGTVREVTLQPGTSDTYELALRQGQSAEVVVRQQGVDVVVEVRDPSGKLLDEIDGPTGRNGDERVEIFASRSGAYHLVVRPYDAKAVRSAIGRLVEAPDRSLQEVLEQHGFAV